MEVFRGPNRGEEVSDSVESVSQVKAPQLTTPQIFALDDLNFKELVVGIRALAEMTTGWNVVFGLAELAGTPEVAKQLEVLRDRVSNEYLPAFSGVSSINELSTQLLRSFMQDVPTLVEIVRREHEVQRDIDSIGTPAQRTAPSSGSQRMLTTMLSLNAIALLR